MFMVIDDLLIFLVPYFHVSKLEKLGFSKSPPTTRNLQKDSLHKGDLFVKHKYNSHSIVKDKSVLIHSSTSGFNNIMTVNYSQKG